MKKMTSARQLRLGANPLCSRCRKPGRVDCSDQDAFGDITARDRQCRIVLSFDVHSPQHAGFHCPFAPSNWTSTPNRSDRMTKTIDALDEIVRTPKHRFPNAESRPGKARQHRYERRKIKEYISLRDWQDEIEPDRRS